MLQKNSHIHRVKTLKSWWGSRNFASENYQYKPMSYHHFKHGEYATSNVDTKGVGSGIHEVISLIWTFVHGLVQISLHLSYALHS